MATPPPAWDTFFGVTAFVTFVLVALARLSAGEVREHEGDAEPLPGSLLLANVLLSQGLLGAVVVGAAWLSRVPPGALGLAAADLTATPLALGLGLGVALALANEGVATVADRVGAGYDPALRELLAPDDARGWALLLLVGLPAVAGFEELLFRGALVGALAAGYGVSPWALAVGSSVLFGLAHGAQGAMGMALAGALGLALAAGFVLTGSLLVPVAAHFVVNALEFLAHEGSHGR